MISPERLAQLRETAMENPATIWGTDIINMLDEIDRLNQCHVVQQNLAKARLAEIERLQKECVPGLLYSQALVERNEAYQERDGLRLQIEMLKGQRDQWKANHDNQVAMKAKHANERVLPYLRELETARGENVRLRAALARIVDLTKYHAMGDRIASSLYEAAKEALAVEP